jgi:hypothetical protein
LELSFEQHLCGRHGFEADVIIEAILLGYEGKTEFLKFLFFIKHFYPSELLIWM